MTRICCCAFQLPASVSCLRRLECVKQHCFVGTTVKRKPTVYSLHMEDVAATRTTLHQREHVIVLVEHLRVGKYNLGLLHEGLYIYCPMLLWWYTIVGDLWWSLCIQLCSSCDEDCSNVTKVVSFYFSSRWSISLSERDLRQRTHARCLHSPVYRAGSL